MKKLILIILLLISKSLFAQDSVSITINAQNRDLEYIASFIFNNNEVENLYDSIKTKYRVAIPPTGATTVVSVTGLTGDWLGIYIRLAHDETAIKANCMGRIKALLLAVNQPYLTGKINSMDAADTDKFQAVRLFGRLKLRRQ